MPLLQDQARKQSFINDIGAMFTNTGGFSPDGKAPADFGTTLSSASEYFAKAKGDSAKTLSGYVQNFINVYENYKLASAGGDPNNQHVNEMLKGIQAMKTGFKAAFDDYVKENKYTALKNKNVKAVSAMMKFAENMGHRVEMEERVQTIDSTMQQINLASQSRTVLQAEFKSYIEECNKNEVDFVSPEHQAKTLASQLKAKTTELETLQKKEQELSNTSNSKELEDVTKCRENLLAYEKKRKEDIARRNGILKLREEFQYTRADIAIIKEKVKSFQDDISELKSTLGELDFSIQVEEGKIIRGEHASERKAELESTPFVKDYNQTFDVYDAMYEAHSAFNNMSDYNVKPYDLLTKNPLSNAEQATLNEYQKHKAAVCDAMPEMKEAFDSLESDPQADIASSILGTIDDKIDELDGELGRFEATQQIKDYKKIKQDIKDGEAAKNVLDGLKKQQQECNKQIEAKEVLIANTKLSGGFAERIEKTLGYMPKPPVTERKLIEAMNSEYGKAKDKCKLYENDPRLVTLKKELSVASERAKEKDVNVIANKVSVAAAEKLKLEEKLKQVQELQAKHSGLKAKSDKLIDDQKQLIEQSPRMQKIGPEKEIYDRLVSIRTRFDTKTNNKKNVDCQNMIDKLDLAITAFGPNSEATTEERQQALQDVHDFAGTYLDVKHAQRIPNWIASEQRMLRIDCAEEMQSFSLTAKNMLSDAEKQPNYNTAYSFSNSPCGERQKSSMERTIMQAASSTLGLASKYNKLDGERYKREHPEVQAPDKTIQNDELSIN